MSNFDKRHRPQDDLFRFVNGIWLEEAQIPADKPRWGAFDALAETALAAQKELLESSELSSRLPLSRQFYSAYMDTDRIEAAGAKPILGLLEEIAGLQTWEAFTDFIAQNYSRHRLAPFSAWVSNDEDRPDFNTLHFWQSGLFLPDESYYREPQHQELRQKFTDLQQSLYSLAGFGDAQKLDTFCERIAKFHWDRAKLRDTKLTHNPMKFSQAVELFGAIDLQRYWDLPSDLVVNVGQVDFVENILALWQEDELESWKNWALCKVVTGYASVLSSDFEAAAFATTRLLSGAEPPERWKTAVSMTNGAVGDEIGQVYVEKFYGADAGKQMTELVANLTAAYNVSISAASWLSEETKAKALEKLGKFRSEIGFPQHWHDYTGLEFGEDLVENLQRVAAFSHARDLKKIGEKVDKLEWHMTPQTVNAYYNPPDNVIVFPAAILQKPFFEAGRDAVWNYGGIGAVIGHEIGHGFDDQGAKYDGDGALVDWWLAADEEAFKGLTANLDAQFEQFVPQQLSGEPGVHVNGKLTTGENVGDICGIKIALLAYALSRGFETIPELIEADAPAVKNFFYSFATIWQNKARDEYARLLLTIDPHSPAEFRANTVRNIDAFHAVFETKPGDALYLEPAARVNIW